MSHKALKRIRFFVKCLLAFTVWFGVTGVAAYEGRPVLQLLSGFAAVLTLFRLILMCVEDEQAASGDGVSGRGNGSG